MPNPRFEAVVWELDEWRCELWSTGADQHELRLFQHGLLLRAKYTPLQFYTALARTWQLEVSA